MSRRTTGPDFERLRTWLRSAVAGAALLLAACASEEPAPVVDLSDEPPIAGRPPATPVKPPPLAGIHRVVRGDTLYAIAFRNGLDYRDVAAWNGIVPPYRIYVGQDLRLSPPGSASMSAAPATSAAAAPRVSEPPAATAVAPPPAKPSAPSPVFEDVPPEPAATATATRQVAEPVATPVGSPAGTSTPAPGTTGSATVATAKSTGSSGKPESSVATAAKPVTPEPPRIAEDSVATTSNGLSWRWPGRGTLASTFVAGDQTRQGIDIAGRAGDPVLAAGDGEVVYSGNGLLGYGELIIVKHNASYLSAYGHNRRRLVQEGDKVKAGQQIAEMGSSAAARDELHFEIRKNGKPVNPLDYLPAR